MATYKLIPSPQEKTPQMHGQKKRIKKQLLKYLWEQKKQVLGARAS